jgi:hypothetical protein
MSKVISSGMILKIKHKTVQWGQEWVNAFGNPEACGVWIIWGNSGNGKSNFVMQLLAELSLTNRVFYNSLEEGFGLTLQQSLQRVYTKLNQRNVLFGKENVDELSIRLNKRRSPDVVIIDSFQYLLIGYSRYRKLKEAFPNKLFILVSHAEGKQPSGRTAKSVKFDAEQKIWVEGFKAISNGRHNPGGEYVIWKEGADAYHGSIGSIGNNFNQ